MTVAKKEWIITGLMSGTSLDGLDLAACRFWKTGNRWEYEILAADTIPYSSSMKNKLTNLMSSKALDYASMDAYFGNFSGEQVRLFHLKNKIKADLVASHGHTIFHQPSKGFTSQIGNGAYIYAKSGIPTVSDFRSVDVALGGQGAPLVPIGDKLLFNQFDICLNLGGIANSSFDKLNKRLAGDICPVNIVLNKLAGEKGKSFDKDGLFASKGKVDAILLQKLNKLSFYKKEFPKSLGREWIDEQVFPLIDKSVLSVEDKLATFSEHIAVQISLSIGKRKVKTLFITGGGAFNRDLIKRISIHVGDKIEVIVPNKLIVSYKEALIFSFLGLKRILGESNALSSVTGASSNSIGGALYGSLK